MSNGMEEREENENKRRIVGEMRSKVMEIGGTLSFICNRMSTMSRNLCV